MGPIKSAYNNGKLELPGLGSIQATEIQDTARFSRKIVQGIQYVIATIAGRVLEVTIEGINKKFILHASSFRKFKKNLRENKAYREAGGSAFFLNRSVINEMKQYYQKTVSKTPLKQEQLSSTSAESKQGIQLSSPRVTSQQPKKENPLEQIEKNIVHLKDHLQELQQEMQSVNTFTDIHRTKYEKALQQRDALYYKMEQLVGQSPSLKIEKEFRRIDELIVKLNSNSFFLGIAVEHSKANASQDVRKFYDILPELIKNKEASLQALESTAGIALQVIKKPIEEILKNTKLFLTEGVPLGLKGFLTDYLNKINSIQAAKTTTEKVYAVGVSLLNVLGFVAKPLFQYLDSANNMSFVELLASCALNLGAQMLTTKCTDWICDKYKLSPATRQIFQGVSSMLIMTLNPGGRLMNTVFETPERVNKRIESQDMAAISDKLFEKRRGLINRQWGKRVFIRTNHNNVYRYYKMGRSDDINKPLEMTPVSNEEAHGGCPGFRKIYSIDAIDSWAPDRNLISRGFMGLYHFFARDYDNLINSG